jgi:hypothetical protein
MNNDAERSDLKAQQSPARHAATIVVSTVRSLRCVAPSSSKVSLPGDFMKAPMLCRKLADSRKLRCAEQ